MHPPLRNGFAYATNNLAQLNPLNEYFDFIEPALHTAVDQYFRGYERPEMATVEFLRCATLLKRATFREEREVRVVAIPGTPGYQKQAAREYPDIFVRKPIPLYMRSRSAISYCSMERHQTTHQARDHRAF